MKLNFNRLHFLYGVLLGLALALAPVHWYVSSMPTRRSPPTPIYVMPQQGHRCNVESCQPSIPPDARRKEFNGRPYYIIPLACIAIQGCHTA